MLISIVTALGAAAAALGAGSGAPSGTAYIVSSRVDPEPILAYRRFGPGNADWQQVLVPLKYWAHTVEVPPRFCSSPAFGVTAILGVLSIVGIQPDLGRADRGHRQSIRAAGPVAELHPAGKPASLIVRPHLRRHRPDG